MSDLYTASASCGEFCCLPGLRYTISPSSDSDRVPLFATSAAFCTFPSVMVRLQQLRAGVPPQLLLRSAPHTAGAAVRCGIQANHRHWQLHSSRYKFQSRPHSSGNISADNKMMSSRGIQSICPVSKSFGALPAAYAGAQVVSRRHAGTIANFKIPTINNEPNVSIELKTLNEHWWLTCRHSNTTPRAQ